MSEQNIENDDKEIVLVIPWPPITALVFEGAGVKGLVYAGALKVLEEKKLLTDLKWVGGSSAGAMTALMVALGYTTDEIEQELETVDFSKFKDHKPSWFGLIGRVITGIRNLFGIKRGYYRGETLYKWIQTIIAEKMGSKTATFADLHKKVGSDSNFKDLFVTVTKCGDIPSTKIFSSESKDSDVSAPMADIVLASMSLPFFFQARYMDPSNYHINWNPTEEEIKSGKLHAFIDGGFLDNDPIDTFSDLKYWYPGYQSFFEDKRINPGVLNLRVDSSAEINSFWNRPNNTVIKFYSWIAGLLNGLSSDANKLDTYRMVSILIPDCDIKTTQFLLTKKQKSDLKQSGSDATSVYIENYVTDAACGWEVETKENFEACRDQYEELIAGLENIKQKQEKGKKKDAPSIEFLAYLRLKFGATKDFFGEKTAASFNPSNSMPKPLAPKNVGLRNFLRAVFHSHGGQKPSFFSSFEGRTALLPSKISIAKRILKCNGYKLWIR